VTARRVEPEWLDELPADDPRAVRSRQDLRRVNSWMAQTAIMRRLLMRHVEQPPRSLMELGAGDGSFTLRLAERLARIWPAVKVVMVDRQDIVSKETRVGFRRLGWSLRVVTADVFDFLEGQDAPRSDLVISNLFIHHFSDAQLAYLFSRMAPLTDLFAATEPRRSGFAAAGTRMLWAIGCNKVTRHDAAVSVQAGFSDGELSRLWPERASWTLLERQAGLFSHCFVAKRATSG